MPVSLVMTSSIKKSLNIVFKASLLQLDSIPGKFSLSHLSSLPQTQHTGFIPNSKMFYYYSKHMTKK